MASKSSKPFRILAIDTSASPGFAVLDVSPGKLPKIVYADAIKTDAKKPDSERFAVVEAMAVMIAFKYGPFDRVVREHFIKGGSKRSTQLVFGAWSAIDSALGRFNYHIDATDEVTPTTVKKAASGNGRAQKDEVEAGVRRLLQLDDAYVFPNNSGGDASDAVAIALAWLSEKGGVEYEASRH